MAEYIDRTALGIGYADPKAFIIPAHAEGWNTAIQIINEAPTADVAPVVHGKWEQVDNTKCRCSRCDIIALIGLYPHGDKNYCPNCGAKMDIDEEGET